MLLLNCDNWHFLHLFLKGQHNFHHKLRPIKHFMTNMVNDKRLESTAALLSELNDTVPSEANFRREYGFRPPVEETFWTAASKNITCSKACFFRLFPIFFWLPRYDFRKNVVLDIIAGLTVSVLQIPHGLAFAPLAGQPPVTGLYMAIFPIIPYVIFGTSRHLSLGMQVILIMMVGKIVETHTTGTEEIQYNATQVAITATFAIGLWQVILGILQLGCLGVLLSNSLVSGLTCGASIHIIFIQLKHVFGIHLPMPSGPLKLVYAAVDLFRKIPETNLFVLGISLVVIIFLYVFNEYLKPKITNKCRVPLPMEFFLICLSIGLSEWFNFEGKNVKIVGDVPSGLPELLTPSIRLLPTIAIDCLVIAIVNISINLSLAKVFAKKGNYEIRENQEMLASGACNIFGSFFQCLPVCAGLSRSAIQFAVGGKTEMTHAVSLLAVLFMLLSLGPLFGKTPMCVLAAIVIVSVKSLFMHIKEFPRVWASSKLDGLVWLVTFISVVLIDIDYGIGLGLAMSVITLIYHNSKTDVEEIALVKNKSENSLNCETLSNPQLKCIQISGAVNFCNASKISEKILNLLVPFFDPSEDLHVIVDLSEVPYVDASGVASFLSFYRTIKSNNCEMFITNCSLSVYQSFHVCKFFIEFPENFVLVSLDAALLYLETKNKK